MEKLWYNGRNYGTMGKTIVLWKNYGTLIYYGKKNYGTMEKTMVLQ